MLGRRWFGQSRINIDKVQLRRLLLLRVRLEFFGRQRFQQLRRQVHPGREGKIPPPTLGLADFPNAEYGQMNQ